MADPAGSTRITQNGATFLKNADGSVYQIDPASGQMINTGSSPGPIGGGSPDDPNSGNDQNGNSIAQPNYQGPGGPPVPSSSSSSGNGSATDPATGITALGANAAGLNGIRDQFSQMATSGDGFKPPTVQAGTVTPNALDVSQSNQARGIQTGGIGVQAGSLATQGAAIGAAGQGLATQQAAGQSYQDVLSGKAPSVAQLQGEQQAAQNTASAYGGAAGASGGNRALALRTAMNGAGANNAQAAAQAAILRATEQANARSGLANVGAGEATTGSTIGGIGNNQAQTGQGITTGGTNIRTGDTNIATTNAANNLAGQTTNAANGLAASTSNAGNAVTANGQNDAFRVGSGNTAVGAGSAAGSSLAGQTTGSLDLKQLNDQESSLLSSGDVKTASPSTSQDLSAISNLFGAFEGATQAPPGTEQNLPGSQVPIMNKPGGSASTPGWEKLLGLGISAAPLIALSSRNVKKDITPSSSEARAMFGKLVPMTFAYKGDKLAKAGLSPPDTDGPKHAGVIAQDVEATGPLGKGMVTTVNGVKAIDLPMAVSALMAAMADIEKRVPKRKAK